MIHGVKEMASERRDLLCALREELRFIEEGGYKTCERFAWRPAFVFQDSPICPNRDARQSLVPCSACALAQLVPEQFRDCDYACRYIPLNADGETVDSLYRSGSQDELESVLKGWLRTVISHLEQELRKDNTHNGSS